jgi:hypothetical protein
MASLATSVEALLGQPVSGFTAASSNSNSSSSSSSSSSGSGGGGDGPAAGATSAAEGMPSSMVIRGEGNKNAEDSDFAKHLDAFADFGFTVDEVSVLSMVTKLDPQHDPKVDLYGAQGITGVRAVAHTPLCRCGLPDHAAFRKADVVIECGVFAFHTPRNVLHLYLCRMCFL